MVLGVNIWRDLFGSIRSAIGGRAKALEKELRSGYALAVDELKKEAYLINANAVIGVYISGMMEVAGEVGKPNDKMMVITATGTAVKTSFTKT